MTQCQFCQTRSTGGLALAALKMNSTGVHFSPYRNLEFLGCPFSVPYFSYPVHRDTGVGRGGGGGAW